MLVVHGFAIIFAECVVDRHIGLSTRSSGRRAGGGEGRHGRAYTNGAKRRPLACLSSTSRHGDDARSSSCRGYVGARSWSNVTSSLERILVGA